MLRNLSSIDTPPVILGNVLSLGDYCSEESDDCDRIVERKFYTDSFFVGLLDSSPSSLASEGERSDLLLFSGMDTIAEEPDEEE